MTTASSAVNDDEGRPHVLNDKYRDSMNATFPNADREGTPMFNPEHREELPRPSNQHGDDDGPPGEMDHLGNKKRTNKATDWPMGPAHWQTKRSR